MQSTNEFALIMINLTRFIDTNPSWVITYVSTAPTESVSQPGLSFQQAVMQYLHSWSNWQCPVLSAAITFWYNPVRQLHSCVKPTQLCNCEEPISSWFSELGANRTCRMTHNLTLRNACKLWRCPILLIFCYCYCYKSILFRLAYD